MGPLRKSLILLGLLAGSGIDILQLRDGKGCLLREIAAVVLVKIHQVRLSLLKLRDDETHLQAPVAQMHIADDPVSHIAGQALYALADYCRS